MYGHPSMVPEHAAALRQCRQVIALLGVRWAVHRPRRGVVEGHTALSVCENYVACLQMSMNHPEVVRCPWCGALTLENDIERPVDYCSHDQILQGDDE